LVFILIGCGAENALTCSKVVAHGWFQVKTRPRVNRRHEISNLALGASLPLPTASAHMTSNFSHMKRYWTTCSVLDPLDHSLWPFECRSELLYSDDRLALTHVLDMTCKYHLSVPRIQHRKDGHHTFIPKDGFTFITLTRALSPTTTFESQKF
jgi:hypothetical protein